jgi:preprotein translocase subunit SecG
MTTVLLVIHIMIAIALIAVVLLQRSEGGALGIGGGGGFMTGRSAGNALTKTTAVLAAAFFATSLTLTLLARNTGTPTSIFNQAGTPVQGGGGSLPGLVLPSAPKPASGAGAPAAPVAPVAPAAPAGPQAPQSK